MATRPLKRPMPLVEVLWEDAASYDGWEVHDEAKGWVKTAHLALTVGYVFERNQHRIVLVQSVSRYSVRAQFKIPMPLIKRIRMLARPER